MSCTIVVLDSDGNSFSVTDAVLDSDGNSFSVGVAANDSEGNSFTIGSCVTASTPTSVGLSGKSTRSTKRGRKGEKLIVVEEVDDLIDEVEEILEEVEQVVRKEPKKKAETPARKPQQEVTTETVFDWLAYYEAMLYRLRDQQRAQALQNRLNMAMTIAVQAYQKAETERLAYEAFLLDEEEVAILLAA